MAWQQWLFQLATRELNTGPWRPAPLLADLVRATASDLLKLGYRPSATLGQLQQGDKPIRLVAEEVWRAMNEIISGDEHGAEVE